MSHKQGLRELLRRRSVKTGDFVLASGKRSRYYIDCKLTTLDPQGSVFTGYTIWELLQDNEVEADAIGGLAVGADTIVTAVSAVSFLQKDQGKPLPGFIIRKERKSHGRQRQIEGIDEQQVKNVVIVDEVCTTGKSTLEAIEIAESEGLNVVAVVSLVDREEGGSELIRTRYNYLPVFTARELLEQENAEGTRSDSATKEDTAGATKGGGRPS